MNACYNIYDSFVGFGFNRYAYCMYNPLKYIDPSGEQYLGWDPSLMNRIEQEARLAVLKFWNQCYDSAIASHNITIAMANCLFTHGQQNAGNGSGNHGSPGGGGSVEVKSLGDGKYKVVNGLYDGGNTVYIVDDQGNRTGVLGQTLTPYTFYDHDNVFVKNKIIDLNDHSGQEFWDTNSNDLPFKIVYTADMILGARGGFFESIYDFKNFEDNAYRAMMVDFGFGRVIATGRDIGNFFAGYLWGSSGSTYVETRSLFNLFQLGSEPNVSKYAQDFGYLWGYYNFYKNNKRP